MNATDIIRAIRKATPAERKQIADALDGLGSSSLTPVQIASNIESIRDALQCLNEAQAVAMLSESSYSVWSTNTAELEDLVAPYLDAHYATLEDDLGRVALLCGSVGRNVLKQAEKRVQKLRRDRGAQEIAEITTLMQMAADAAKPDEDHMIDHDKADQAAIDAYNLLLADYANAAGTDGAAPVFGGFTMADIHLLRSCKKFIRIREKHIFNGPWKALNERLADLFGKCRREGIDPFARADRHRIRIERAKYPNVLFAGLRKGEPAKWGAVELAGYLMTVKVFGVGRVIMKSCTIWGCGVGACQTR